MYADRLPMRPALAVLLGVLFPVLGLACTSGGGGWTGASAPAVSQGAASSPIPPPALLATRYEDQNQDGTVDSGDVLVLTFSDPVTAQGAGSTDLSLGAAGDTFGAGAFFEPGSGSTEARLRLGSGVSLSLFGTYIPNDLPNGSPATVSVAGTGLAGVGGPATGGPIPIVATGTSALSFLGCGYPDDPAFSAYYGTLHAHTGYSDGAGNPAAACAYARDTAGLDFFAVTDHLEQILFPSYEYSDTWYAVNQESRPGRFVGLAGYEWGGGPVTVVPLLWSNHMNIIGDSTLMPVVVDRYSLYRQLCERPDDVVGQFNHPGERQKGSMQIDLWGDFEYDAQADRRMRLVRTEPGRHDDTVGYIPCLDKGWHVSPQSSQDNHDADWGTRNLYRTGILANSLTRDSVLNALREMRTFSTSDPDASISAVADSAWIMGSTLFGSGSHQLEVRVADGSGDGFARLELITLAGAVADQHDPGGSTTATWTVTVDPPGDCWYYFRAFQLDGDKLYSAPFFVDR
ncbi:hypothetical protein ACFL59_08860 [Planctomycetota bacterium]